MGDRDHFVMCSQFGTGEIRDIQRNLAGIKRFQEVIVIDQSTAREVQDFYAILIWLMASLSMVFFVESIRGR